ncbi:MAG: beta-propeller fold lactonase family protein [Blastocatellia bacterium]
MKAPVFALLILLSLCSAACNQPASNQPAPGQSAPQTETARTTPPPYLIYVTNEGSGDITVIDPVKQEAIGTYPLGKRPRGLHASPDGRVIYVALSGSPFAPPGVDESTLPPPDKSADGIGVFDVAQNKVARILPGGSDPEQFDLSADGSLIYVANEDAAGASIIETATGKIRKTLPAGGEPEGVTLSPDGKFVYVTSENDSKVTVIDTAKAAVVTSFKTGARPRSISFLPDGSRAFVTNENGASLTMVDARAHKPTGEIKFDADLKPMGQAMAANGAALYVSTGRGKKVMAVDTATGRVTGSVEAGTRPWGLTLSPDGKYLFTANGPAGDVSMIDVATLSVVKKIKAGDRPWGVIALAK